MNDTVYVLQGDQAVGRLVVEDTGRVILPLSVDGYACVVDTRCTQLVIGLPVSTLADLERVLREVVPLAGAAGSAPSGAASSSSGPDGPLSDPFDWLAAQLPDQAELAQAVAFYSRSWPAFSADQQLSGNRAENANGQSGGQKDSGSSVWSHVIRFMAR